MPFLKGCSNELFEQSHTWDELIQHFVDSYVMETDKKAVSAFYDRDYIAERLKGLETELSLETGISILPSRYFTGPDAFGLMSNSKICVGNHKVAHEFGISTTPLR